LPRSRRAGFDAGAAKSTGFDVISESAVLGENGVIRTNLQTLTAKPTAGLQDDDLGFRRQTFRVMTPPAAQWASLKEYRGADPRPVLDGIFLYVENQPAAHYLILSREHRGYRVFESDERRLPT